MHRDGAPGSRRARRRAGRHRPPRPSPACAAPPPPMSHLQTLQSVAARQARVSDLSDHPMQPGKSAKARPGAGAALVTAPTLASQHTPRTLSCPTRAQPALGRWGWGGGGGGGRGAGRCSLCAPPAAAFMLARSRPWPDGDTRAPRGTAASSRPIPPPRPLPCSRWRAMHSRQGVCIPAPFGGAPGPPPHCGCARALLRPARAVACGRVEGRCWCVVLQRRVGRGPQARQPDP